MEQMYIQGYQTPVFIPNLYDQVKKNSFLVKFFHFQGTNVHLGVPNSSFYPHRVKKTSFLVKFFHFQGTNVHLGVPNSSFYPQFVRLGKKKLHFQGNFSIFRGTKKSPFKKNFIFSEIFHFQGTNVHLGYQTPVFIPFLVKSGTKKSLQKNFIFSEIFPFLGNKCTFGGTKLQFLSPICIFRDTFGVPNSKNDLKKT